MFSKFESLIVRYGGLMEKTMNRLIKQSGGIVLAALLLLMASCGDSVVIPVITITGQPQSVVVTEGSITGVLEVTATVTLDAELSYQWYSGVTLIGGETGASFTIPTTLSSPGTYNYHCVVSATDGAEPKTSQTAAVMVNYDAGLPNYDKFYVGDGQARIYYKTITTGGTNVEVTNKCYLISYENESAVSNSYRGPVNIPATVVYDGATYRVRRVSHGAFYGSTGLTSVTLAEGIDYLEAYAFYGCTSLASVTLPSTLTDIDSHVFINCGALASLHLPASITYINELNPVFSGCANLSLSAASGGALSVDNKGVLFRGSGGNASYFLHWIPEKLTGEYVIPDGVVEITRAAVFSSRLTKISIPASVTTIRTNFNNTLLTDIVLNWTDPNTATTILFDGGKSTITLHVPAGTVGAYEAHSVWGVGLGTSSGFKAIVEQ